MTEVSSERVNRALPWITGAALIALPFVYHAPYPMHLMIVVLIWSFAYTSWSVMGRFGLVSLGHGGFFGVGAYSAGLLALHGIVNEPVAALVVAGLAASVVGFLTSFLVIRGVALTRLMVTLGIALLLEALAERFNLRRRDDPLSVLHDLNKELYHYFDYKPKSTNVDSPIDLALGTKAGVCQDFAHIMITLVRSKLRIPCRYVSGYLFHGESDMDRSISSATHAWIEALIPHLGWVGFDPTNWLVAGDRHIRTAIGRDNSDVPPTHGIFRGRAASELTVAVRVTPSLGTPSLDQELPVPEDWSILVEKATQLPEQPPPPTRQQQMAQQQQDIS